ncbi:hypothetical protein NQ318_009584 [Aromia moschata]|uniref:acid phosphatase n=1 Tax=Aromia moschata TaxID=1265417 RepID=A0AAV8Y496_9CUCU|nr:hypothetical protein NQ318_009584 [Aromia moschata]
MSAQMVLAALFPPSEKLRWSDELLWLPIPVSYKSDAEEDDDMNYTLPNWTKQVYPEQTENAASYMYGYHNYELEVKKINSGYLLKKILDDGTSKIKNAESEKKLYLYSGHESTVGYMMDALGIAEQRVPPYGCALSFELWKLDNEYYIRLRYRNDPEATVPVDLKIPGCDVMCPHDTFTQLLSDVIPTIPITEACNASYE